MTTLAKFYTYITESLSTCTYRFGFLPSSVRVGNNKQLTKYELSSVNEEYHQYVHCTGGMFVIIEDVKLPIKSPVVKETPKQLEKHNSGGNLGSRGSNLGSREFRSSNSLSKKSSAELRKDYIARQTSQTINQQKYETDIEIGFLWSWNFMSSRKWRSPNTGDEHFQDTVLRDFRAFCSNSEQRLQEFWTEYKEQNLV